MTRTKSWQWPNKRDTLPIVNLRKNGFKYGLYKGFHWFYEKPEGGPFLKHEAKSWWDINGFIIGWSYYRVMLIWKRRKLKF